MSLALLFACACGGFLIMFRPPSITSFVLSAWVIRCGSFLIDFALVLAIGIEIIMIYARQFWHQPLRADTGLPLSNLSEIQRQLCWPTRRRKVLSL